MISYSIETFVE